MNPLIKAGMEIVWHAIRRTISVVCVLLVIVGIWWAVYRVYIKPRPTTTNIQKAETIQNVEYHYNYNDKEKAFLGLKIWKFRIGVSIK